MALMAIAIPILPGKTEQWQRFINEVNGPRRNDFNASRRRLEVRERTFLQQTPNGDMVIVTLEGANPEAAFRAFGSGNDPFTQWFRSQVMELHGVDLAKPPPGPLPSQIIDTQAS